MADTHLELIAKNVLDIAFRIHTKFGPGLLESVYKMMLYHELVKMGYKVDVEKSVSFEFEGHCYENAFRADLIIDDCFIVETKSTELMHPVYGKQLKTYLTLTDMRLGLLLNFGMASLKDGIERVVNKYY